MSVTVQTHQSYFSRLGKAFKGILAGVSLFFGAILLLFWNEGRTVRRSTALKEGVAAVVAIDAAQIDPANNGKLVHIADAVTVHDSLSDPLLEGEFEALGLVRDVEVYQWQETATTEEKINIGGSSDTVTTYDYKKDWSPTLVDSSNFKEAGHDNPAAYPVEPRAVYARGVTVGAFRIPDSRVPSMGVREDIAMPAVTNALPAGAPAGLLRTRGGYYFSAAGATNVPAAPAIGDARVSFAVKRSYYASFVAVQQNGALAPYVAKNGGTVFLQADGIHTPGELFASAKSANKMAANLLRLGGFLLMTMGLGMVLTPLKVLADVLPFLGRVAGMGVGLAAMLASLVVSLVTIALAWIAYRPALGVSLLVVAAAAGFLLWKKSRGAKQGESK